MSEQVQHTPGPWEVVRAANYVQVKAADGRGIADMFDERDWPDNPTGEADYNARLIAAAPWMYDALEAIIEADGNVIEINAIARTALAQAKGTQQPEPA